MGSLSSSPLSPLLQKKKKKKRKRKKKNRSPGQKAGFFMSIINTPSHYEIVNRHRVSGMVTLFFEY